MNSLKSGIRRIGTRTLLLRVLLVPPRPPRLRVRATSHEAVGWQLLRGSGQGLLEFKPPFPFDRRLIAEEIAASRAYVRALERCGAIKPDEATGLDGALRAGSRSRCRPTRLPGDGAEDVHSFVETRLTEAVGDSPGPPRRSRNEQSVTGLRLWLRRTTTGCGDGVARLVEALSRAGPVRGRRGDAGLHAHPRGGADHLRPSRRRPRLGPRAGPRAARRCPPARQRAALAGSARGHGASIDREALARDLGFDQVSRTRSTRDGPRLRGRVVFAARSSRRTCLGSPKLDFFWLSSPIRLFALPESFTTGSSSCRRRITPTR